MKNIKAIVCYGAGILLSLLTFAWYALDGLTSKVKVTGQKFGTSVYDIIKSEGADGAAKTSQVFSIITMVLACVFAVVCVLGLLNSLGVLKFSWLKWVVVGAGVLLVVASLVAMVTMMSYASDMSKPMGDYGSVSVGVGLILTFVFSVVATCASVVPAVGKND